MKKYIKPDVEVTKFDIADVITDSSIFNPFAQNAVEEGVYIESDGYIVAIPEE